MAPLAHVCKGACQWVTRLYTSYIVGVEIDPNRPIFDAYLFSSLFLRCLWLLV